MTLVTFCYRAIDHGSWQKPIHIIDEGKFGQVLRIVRVRPEEFVYQIVLETDDDPEEILNELRQNGTIHVLLMMADEHEIFRNKKWSHLCIQNK